VNDRPTIHDSIRALATERAAYTAAKALYDAFMADFEAAHAGLSAEIAAHKAAVTKLECAIRTEGADIAAVTREAPAPGTKLRYEKVVVYRTADPNGELITMDPAKATGMVRDYLIEHGWTSHLKPDMREFEKIAKSIPEADRPSWVSVEARAVVSIDTDLSAFVETEAEAGAEDDPFADAADPFADVVSADSVGVALGGAADDAPF
jgi:hypothetical protein